MMRHSFSFNGVDMREAFGIVVERFVDVLTPALRTRKIALPYRDGSYDFGAQYYDERVITIDCATASLASRAAARALSLALAGKGELRRWDEPDKYYTGRIYDPADIERMAQGAMRFSISFVCEPFAYGAQKTLAFAGSTDVEYAGSARTPVRMVIRNDNDFAITGIVITATERAE